MEHPVYYIIDCIMFNIFIDLQTSGIVNVQVLTFIFYTIINQFESCKGPDYKLFCGEFSVGQAYFYELGVS